MRLSYHMTDCVQGGATEEGPSLIHDILSPMLSANCVFKIIHRVLFFSCFVPPRFMQSLPPSHLHRDPGYFYTYLPNGI